jgi:hypothetical protein
MSLLNLTSHGRLTTSDGRSVGIVRLRTKGHGSFPGGGNILYLFHKAQTAFMAHLSSCPLGTFRAGISSYITGPEREANHSPPSSSVVSNGGDIPPLFHTFSRHGAQLSARGSSWIIFPGFVEARAIAWAPLAQ